MNNYKCLNDNDCNILFNPDAFSSDEIAVLKSDEMVVSVDIFDQSVLINQVGATVNYVVYGFVLLVAIILLSALLNKLFTK